MSTTLQDLKPAQLRQHEHNPRKNVGNVDELAASIAEQGIIEPLIVAPVESKAATPQYLVIAGHRRLAAAKAAKLKTVPCLVRDDLVEPVRQLEAMLVENLQRSDLSPIEEGDAYQMLLEYPGYTQKKITAATGRTSATVRGRLKLAKLPHATKAKIQSGQISMSDALALTEFANDSARYKVLEKALGTGEFGWRLAEAKRSRDADKRRDRTRRDLDAAGVRLLNVRPMTATHFYATKDIEDHRGCEGFAAYLDHGGRAAYVCDKPELHRAERAAAAAGEPPDDGEDYSAHAAALAAAAITRRQFLAERINGGGFSPEDALTELVGEIMHKVEHNADGIFVLLGMLTGKPVVVGEDVEFDEATVGALRDELVAALSDLGIYQLIMCWDIAKNLWEESYLLEVDSWPRFATPYVDRGVAVWRSHLEDVYGYQWTEAESALLEAPSTDAAES